MKINIWIKKEELFNGRITKYHTHVKNIDHEKYISISLTADEFFKLEDNLDLEDTMTELEERIHKESQSKTGEEFGGWFRGLNKIEKETYTKIYGH